MSRADNAEAVAGRTAREKAAHEDSHIDDKLRKWWAVFPHVFTNPSMERLHAFFREQLGFVENELVLDLGCGQGDFALWLLDQDAIVFGVDLSEFNIRRSKEKAYAKGVAQDRYSFAVMDAVRMAFPDKVFDRVVGNGILHHVDLRAVMAEIDRILKPGAKALFQEPLGGNPLMRLYRFVAGIHTIDERPLTRGDIIYLTKEWKITAKYTGLVTFPISLLTSIILRHQPTSWILQVSNHFEDWLHSRGVPEHWNRFAVLCYEPKPNLRAVVSSDLANNVDG
jgi:SAM-dependent methyltransferase